LSVVAPLGVVASLASVGAIINRRKAVTMSALGDTLRPGAVWAVGKNYLEHIKELKGLLNIDQSIPTEPLIFLKSGSSVLAPLAADARDTPQELPLPVHWSNDVQHEVELAVEVGPDGVPRRAAVALDLTARDVQAAMKAKGFPWTLAKSFQAACPLGPAFSTQGVDLGKLELGITVNGQTRQRSTTDNMIFPVPTLVDFIAARFPLQEGDVVLTGTPEGVGRLVPGDKVEAWVSEPGTGRVLSRGSWICTAARPHKPKSLAPKL